MKNEGDVIFARNNFFKKNKKNIKLIINFINKIRSNREYVKKI